MRDDGLWQFIHRTGKVAPERDSLDCYRTMKLEEIPLVVWALYALVINGTAFVSFGIDKALARGWSRRISEGTLLGWALLGGTAGAYAGRVFFRHKTRKQPFSNQLHYILILQLAVLAFAVTWWTTG